MQATALIVTAFVAGLPSLMAYLVMIALAAFAGGSSVALLTLGHRRLQVLLSLTGGVLLGVGMLHLLPHAFLELGRQIEATMGWVLAGFFFMFLLERAFHSHAHHTADGDAAGHSHGPACVHQHESPAAEPLERGQRRWSWAGALAGLALHSLADGAALAASVEADAAHGAGFLAGFATFLAILLHKPFDAGIITALMLNAGISRRTRLFVNGCYAAVVPLGAAAFLVSLRFSGPQEQMITGAALGLAAGAFICIAAADLLPEVQFHSHDRVLLSLALALGIAIAWGISLLERSVHSHEDHRPAGISLQTVGSPPCAFAVSPGHGGRNVSKGPSLQLPEGPAGNSDSGRMIPPSAGIRWATPQGLLVRVPAPHEPA